MADLLTKTRKNGKRKTTALKKVKVGMAVPTFKPDSI
jgi:hypothetical protein